MMVNCSRQNVTRSGTYGRGGVVGAAGTQSVRAGRVSEQHQGFGYGLARPVVVARNGAGEISAATDPFVNGHAMSF